MNQSAIEQDAGVLRLTGQVTIATAAALERELRACLADAGLPPHVTLDCSRVDMADSAAIGLLVEAHRQLAANGRSMEVVGLRPHLVSLVKIYGVEWILAAP